jgi:hypothetical protein
MAEKRKAKRGNQHTTFVMKSGMPLLTRKIEVKKETMYVNPTGCVVVIYTDWLTIWQAVLLCTTLTGGRYGRLCCCALH